jgi:multidrug efflux pump subunit AcrA (membrane-fusion protein)
MPQALKSILRAIAGLAILAVGVGTMNALISMKPKPSVVERPVAPRAVRTAVVNPGDCIPQTPVEGRVEALYRMDIISEMTGDLILGGKEFREGVEFAKGEVMLQLEATEAHNALTAQRSQFLQLLSTSLADLRADFPDNWSSWESFLEAMDVDVRLPELPAFGSQREELFVANRGILSLFHSIRSAEERLDKYTVVAPFDGVVTAAAVRPGGLVRAGQLAGVLVGRGAYEVKTAVHARYLTTIALGDAVVFVDENNQPVAQGTVHRVAGNVDAATQSASVYCRVQPVDGKSTLLRDGRFLTGTIASDPVADGVNVPLNLLMDGGSVYAVEAEQLKKVPVEVAFESRSEAIVLGLDSGTVVLSEAVASAFDGMPVQTTAE